MVNLLIETDTFDKGGLQKVILDLALRFDKNKFNTSIVSIGNTGFLSDIAVKKGIKVFDLSSVKDKEKKYKEILEENNINLICSHYSNFGYLIGNKLSIKNITYIHNVYAFLSKDKIKEFQDDDKYVDLYISVSDKAKEYAIERLKIDADKIITIPNGLILEEHIAREKIAEKLDRKDFNVSESDYVFLNVATYNLHKGHYLMMDAMRHILKTRTDIKILCIGNVFYQPHADMLDRDLKDFGLDKYISLIGYHPDIESFHKMADAFLLPSFIEGWSIAMTEAMYYGKPMVLTDTGGSSTVIENDDIGILVPNEYGASLNLYATYLDSLAHDVKTYKTSKILADAMMNFADNREYWKEAGKKGKIKVLEKYDLNKIIIETERIYLDLLK